MDVQACLASVDAALADADAQLSTDLGDHHELTTARLWRSQVLVDWEPDDQAGDCLLRPALLRRLVALHAQVDANQAADELSITAPGRVVAALSAEHADLVARLGGARRVEMRATLRFEAQTYRGGHETYFLLDRGKRVPLLNLTADISPRAREASQRSSPAQT